MRWLEQYQGKKVDAATAAQTIQSGDRVLIHPGCATPQRLVDAMVNRWEELSNVEVMHLLTFGRADYVDPRYAGHFRHNSLFAGGNVRHAINNGLADHIPIFLSEIPELFKSGALPIDVAMIHVSPPDEHGFCSFGVGAEITKPGAESARDVIAQVNPNMPRVHGDNFIHLNKIKYLVEADDPVIELPGGSMTDEQKKIGRFIADLIPDGATIQMGIGGIPDAVLFHLHEKKDLGVHTEMFSDGVVEMVEAGVITNEKKSLHPGKIIASFVMGTKRLYEFIDNNPLIEFHPSHYVNDPFIIARNDNMIAINSALQVDLTGQVVSDSIGYRIYSGVGGQVDFIRGAAHSNGGKPLIALPSTARKGKVSRIVLHPDEGAGVVTSRADVHYVVTENGVAQLHGKNIRQRAEALISIAHPRFQDQLKFDARKMQLI